MLSQVIGRHLRKRKKGIPELQHNNLLTIEFRLLALYSNDIGLVSDDSNSFFRVIEKDCEVMKSLS